MKLLVRVFLTIILYPFRGHGGVQQCAKAALYEHLWVRYLAPGYLRSAVKLFWHLPCFVCTRARTQNPPLLNPAPYQPEV